jgi:hypothetical protein
MKSGMKYLTEAFYRSIKGGTLLPIPYRQVVLTARIMDEIFEQINRGRTWRKADPPTPQGQGS